MGSKVVKTYEIDLQHMRIFLRDLCENFTLAWPVQIFIQIVIIVVMMNITSTYIAYWFITIDSSLLIIIIYRSIGPLMMMMMHCVWNVYGILFSLSLFSIIDTDIFSCQSNFALHFNRNIKIKFNILMLSFFPSFAWHAIVVHYFHIKFVYWPKAKCKWWKIKLIHRLYFFFLFIGIYLILKVKTIWRELEKIHIGAAKNSAWRSILECSLHYCLLVYYYYSYTRDATIQNMPFSTL